MATHGRARGERLFGLLLRLYPPAFRDRYRLDLIEAFRRDRGQPRFRGLIGAVRFWRHTVADVLRTAAGERRGAVVPATAGRSRWRQGLLQDLSAIGRGFRKQPGYAAVATLTLGLGVGATTAVFAVVDGVLLTPLPYAEAGRLVRVYELEHGNPAARMAAYGNFADLRAQATGFEELALWQGQSLTLTGDGPARSLSGRMTSAGFASVFRETPVLGRWFTEQETIDDAPVAVLAHALWQDTFGADPTIVGRRILLDGRSVEVIGVMRTAFRYPGTTDVWLPLPPVRDPVGQRRWHRHSMVGRLAGGKTLAQLNTELAGLGARLEAAYPEYNKNNYFEARPLLADMVGARRQSLLLLFGAVAVLLLIACVNVASLSLARSVSRRHEMAVRSALGASRWRLARLVLTESLIVGVAGGAIAIVLEQFAVVELLALAADTVPRASAVTALSPPVLAFGGVASLLAALAVALPVVFSGRRDVEAATFRNARGSASRGVMRGRRVLVVAQLTAAFVLATGAGLLVRSVVKLQAIESGVRADRVLTFDIVLPATRYADAASVARFVDALTARFEQQPTVVRAGATLTAPVDPYGWYNSLTIRGRDVPTPDLPHVSYVPTSAGYFAAVGIPIIAGRTYDAGEPRGRPVAVINRTAARQFWPDQDPIGQLIFGRPGDDRSWATIVGVVGDVRQALDAPADPTVYIPLAQEIVQSLVVVVRTTVDDPRTPMPALRAVLMEADSDVPITHVMPLDERIAQTTAAPAFNAVLMTAFAGTALLLAGAGVFAMISFSVAERRREFGIRAAVGASRPRIFLHVLGTNLRLAAWAVAIGLVCVTIGGRALDGLLFGVGAADLSTMAGVAAVVGGVVLAAGLWPARAATAVDPLVALRSE